MPSTDKRKGSKGKPENLVPIQSRATEVQREIQSKGGKAHAEKVKKQVLISNIFADYLIEEHEVVLRDDEGNVIDRTKLSAKDLIKRTITGVMAREDSASVAMMKTIGEITEGKNVNLTGSLITHEMTPEELDKRLDELEKKRKVEK